MFDELVVLAYASGMNKRLKSVAGICLVRERVPLVMEKQIAGPDYFLEGRFIFGAGAGKRASQRRCERRSGSTATGASTLGQNFGEAARVGGSNGVI